MISAEEIKKYVQQKKVIIGTERTIKALKNGKILKVFISSNCKEDTRNDLERYGKISSIEIIKLKFPNDELGTICKKPFLISVMGLKKE